MSSTRSDKLYIFTSTFPFGWGESYLRAEVDVLCKYFDRIILVPLKSEGSITYTLPKNVEIFDFTQLNRKISVFEEWFFFRRIFLEGIHSRRFFSYLSKYRKMRSILKRSFLLADTIGPELDQKAYLYSFWMNEWALMLAILKEKGKIGSFIFRVNGYDIYDDRSPDGFIPFRMFIYKNTNAIYPVSENASHYLIKNFGFENKISTSYFGSVDYGTVINDSHEELRLYSCARLIPLKNCIQIAQILSSSKMDIHWHHHGDGPELDRLNEMVSLFPSNIRFTQTSFTDQHSEAIRIQKEFNPDVFISLSRSEGLPVTIMEAISMGIPVIATDVGGCAELVNEETGILLSSIPTNREVEIAIQTMNEEKWRNSTKRNMIRNYWQNNFSANSRYSKFALKIKQS